MNSTNEAKNNKIQELEKQVEELKKDIVFLRNLLEHLKEQINAK